LTKDIFYTVREERGEEEVVTDWEGAKTGRDRYLDRNGKEMTITSAEVQGSASVQCIVYVMISRNNVISSL